jgi:hypothetical protein
VKVDSQKERDQRLAFEKVYKRQCWVMWTLVAVIFLIAGFGDRILAMGDLSALIMIPLGLYMPFAIIFGVLNYRCPKCRWWIYYTPRYCRNCGALLKGHPFED